MTFDDLTFDLTFKITKVVFVIVLTLFRMLLKPHVLTCKGPEREHVIVHLPSEIVILAELCLVSDAYYIVMIMIK